MHVGCLCESSQCIKGSFTALPGGHGAFIVNYIADIAIAQIENGPVARVVYAGMMYVGENVVAPSCCDMHMYYVATICNKECSPMYIHPYLKMYMNGL